MMMPMINAPSCCSFVSDDDCVQIRVELTVEKDERWAYDSRAATGHVGLKNQGATCYMNSLLQYLFHLPFFRKASGLLEASHGSQDSTSVSLLLVSCTPV